MIIHEIAPEHLDLLSRLQHTLEYLQTEQARIQGEMVTIAQQWQREESKLRSVIQQLYGIQGDFSLDTKSGTVSVPAEVVYTDPERTDADNAQ